MGIQVLTDSLNSVEATIGQFEAGGNFIERRDAAETLAVIAREIVFALRRGSADSDPDVSHTCRQSIQAVTSDLTDGLESIEIEIVAAKRMLDHLRASSGGASGDEAKGASTGESRPATHDEIRRWLIDLAQEQKAPLEEKENRCILDIALQQGRRQKVYIDLGQRDSGGEELIILYTLCGPAQEKIFRGALKANARLSHAAFALHRTKNEETLILLGRRRLAGLTADALKDDVMYLARKGDLAEAQLLKGEDDRH